MFQTLKLSWSLPVQRDDLVLEIGSGAYPLLRADVLMDKYPVVSQAHRTSLRPVEIDQRPFIVGDAQALPFVDNAFDFIIARHIIEHLHDPVKFVAELKRVSKAGYIVAPSPFTELVHGGYQNIDTGIPPEIRTMLHHGRGTPGHQWFVLGNSGRLFLTAKSSNHYALYLLLGSFIKKNTGYRQERFFRKNREWAETALYWDRDTLDLHVMDDSRDKNEEKIDTEKLISGLLLVQKKAGLSALVKAKVRQGLFATRRQYDIYALLACPVCKKKMTRTGDNLCCPACGRFPVVNNIPVLLAESLNKKVTV